MKVPNIVFVFFACFVLIFSGCENLTTNSSSNSSSPSSSSGTTVTISNASTKVTYSAVLVVDGTDESYSDTTFASRTANQIAVLIINGGSLALTDCTITKSGDGTSSTSSGTTASADDSFNFYGLNSAIVCVGSGSSLTLDGCTVTTGAHCAALATDRGGGTVRVTGSDDYGCTLSTEGDGSPCIYSTGAITPLRM